MSKKKCNTIELKKLGNFGILSSLDGDSMAERNLKREYENRKKNKRQIVVAIENELYLEFQNAAQKNSLPMTTVLKQFIIDYIEKHKS